MKHGSTFSGIGMFDLAAEWMGWENIFHCENNQFCQKVLKHYWPQAKSYGDIKQTDFTVHRGKLNVFTGGFPCQKFSVAGSQTGDGELIGEMLRGIGESDPDWVVAENVGNVLNKKFKAYLDFLVTDLENKGFQTPLVFDCTADTLGLPTLERHIWFITQANRKRQKGSVKKKIQRIATRTGKFSGSYQGEYDRWQLPESRVCELGKGNPAGLDTTAISATKWHGESIQAIGNSISPQVAYEIFKTIESLNGAD